ncbi:MAG TPA: HEAT repeat domain-containing protein [Solirubrobacteraceae bacterium]|nr:HEAT repeat domain-containing protein [Solirubrobacteraceae bacterium]
MDAAAVIAALDDPGDDAREVMRRLEAEAPPAALAGALAGARRAHTRQLAADLLGRQADPEGAPQLLAALSDPDAGVRASAADALGKVLLTHGPQVAPDAGTELLRAWDRESDPAVRHMLAAALGAAGHREAIPLLRAAAASGDRGLEHAARWALERLGG